MTLDKTSTIQDIYRHLQQGQFVHAETKLLQLVQTQSAQLQAWYLLADVSLKLKKHEQALKAAQKAFELSPVQPQVRILLSHCFLLNGEFTQASNHAINLFNENPKLLAKDWFQLGICLYQVNQYKNALTCFKHAVELEPDNALYQYNLATSYRNNGDKKQAARHLNLAIKLDPINYDAQLSRSLLSKATEQKQNITTLKEALKNSNLSITGKIKLNFALAKEYEDLEQYNDNYQHLTSANQLRAEQSNYHVEKDVESLERIIEVFSNAIPDWRQKQKETSQDYSNVTPVFITGLPRTGSTLLEQIIQQHKTVGSAGELHHFGNCLSKEINVLKVQPKNKNEFIKCCAELDMREVGLRYLSELQPFIANNKLIIDKLPLNFLYTGLIQRALPLAKVIHMTRSPMATAYAIYKTYFEQAYPFSYRLVDIGHYYVAYRKLMAHWLEQNSHNLLFVNYEALVTNPESTCKPVFDFLGLGFDTDYIQLNNNRAVSATASSAQVRDGIYTSSVQSWKHYKEQLSEFKDILLKAGISPEQW